MRLAALLIPWLLSGAAEPAAPLSFSLKEVGPGVYAAIDGPNHKAGANAGFVIGDDGVLVIDSFINRDAARELVGSIRKLTSKPIRYIVNTHYHLDHTGGDAVLREAGAIIIAHRNVRAWLRTSNMALFGDRITPSLKEQIEELPLPDVTTDRELTVWLGSRRVVVRTVLGHTGGDLSVFVPDAKVLFTGDLFWRKVPPNLIDGSVKEWAATDGDFTRSAQAQHMTFVPGHGDVSTVNDVRDFQAYLLDLQKFVAEARRLGLSKTAMTSFVLPRLRARHPDWTISDRSAALEIGYMDEELAGTKRRPVPVSE